MTNTVLPRPTRVNAKIASSSSERRVRAEEGEMHSHYKKVFYLVIIPETCKRLVKAFDGHRHTAEVLQVGRRSSFSPVASMSALHVEAVVIMIRLYADGGE